MQRYDDLIERQQATKKNLDRAKARATFALEHGTTSDKELARVELLSAIDEARLMQVESQIVMDELREVLKRELERLDEMLRPEVS